MAIVENEERENGKVRFLIDKATNSTDPEINPRLLKAIKTVVRYSDSELRIASQTLMHLMKRDHSQVRYLALLIIDELFMRSKLFRSLLVEDFDKLLSLSIGFRRNMPLPAPASVASVLRSKGMEFLEKWNISFGVHYRQIRLGFEYLKNTLRFQFPNIQDNAARIEQERRDREIRSKEILLNKYETLKRDITSIKDEIQLNLDEIGQCLEILRNEDENMQLEPLDDDEIVEFHSSELRQIRLDSLKEGEKVHENNENKVVFDALRELYKLLVTHHLVSVQEWISVLIRVEVTDNRFRNNTLKEFIDIRNRIRLVKQKCEESGCSFPCIVSGDEEDFWEEGKIESNEQKSTIEPTKHIEDPDVASISDEVKRKAPKPSSKKAKGKEKLGCDIVGNDSSSLKMKLVDDAPVKKWGPFLDNWGSKRDVMANQRGLELESHWGRVDYDAVIPGEKIAELNFQATVYEEEHVEIQPCRAHLRKGGLCERRDLKVCPFHGPIVPRDDEGQPINQTSSLNEIRITETSSKDDVSIDMESSDLNILEQLSKQAVKNVRERDKDELKKMENDQKIFKRARLAKVREHNDLVLRDAALASTSRSSAFGEELETSNGDKISSRNKKETLASMKRKKVTTKDRIGQKLLNTRVRDATTRQVTMGEDAKYREAFPNQW